MAGAKALCDLGEINPHVCQHENRIQSICSALHVAPGSAMDGFNIRVISLSPWVDGSLPGLEWKMLADIHESKGINDFSFSHLG